MEESEKPPRKKNQINHAHSWNTDRSPERQVKISISSEGVVKQGVLQAVDWYVIGTPFLEAIWWCD